MKAGRRAQIVFFLDWICFLVRPFWAADVAAPMRKEWLLPRDVTRHLSHETRQDTRLGSRERDETRFLDFFFFKSSMMKYIGKTQNAKNVGAF